MSKHRETTPCRDLKVRFSRSTQKRSETSVTTSATPSSLFPSWNNTCPLVLDCISLLTRDGKAVTDGHGSSDTAKLVLHSNSTSLPQLKAPESSDNPSTTYQVASRFEPRSNPLQTGELGSGLAEDAKCCWPSAPLPPDPTLPTSDVPSPAPPNFVPSTYVSPNLIVMAGRTERRSTGDRPTAPDENSLH
ncbi:hypothetical protein CH63R_05762 [Colletotrichum higginsianum IMI 349063]|uniref:Uncharacterized protein n=1 Tax=Colletotrichum higginsianum (strain IMI 349063) TaxID=759273 RepID=A0A1B7YDT4_COLHI|nr:hypothetical protein CH63R_05762 [Colletotrichum higginsianum IMI 349063]OBR10070.1 hypothetical protein CH63R_05762 [Colletotrichum higginsianum IMI 349063]